MAKEKANAELRAEVSRYKYGELAEEVGIHWVTLSKWFRSEESMNNVRRLRILDALKRLDEKKAAQKTIGEK